MTSSALQFQWLAIAKIAFAIYQNTSENASAKCVRLSLITTHLWVKEHNPICRRNIFLTYSILQSVIAPSPPVPYPSIPRASANSPINPRPLSGHQHIARHTAWMYAGKGQGRELVLELVQEKFKQMWAILNSHSEENDKSTYAILQRSEQPNTDENCGFDRGVFLNCKGKPWNILDLRSPLPPSTFPSFLTDENGQLLPRIRDAVLMGGSPFQTRKQGAEEAPALRRSKRARN